MEDKEEYYVFDKVMATFQPQRTDDLAAHAPPVGLRTLWNCCWTMEAGSYAGQNVWLSANPEHHYGWVPECDLVDIERVR